MLQHFLIDSEEDNNSNGWGLSPKPPTSQLQEPASPQNDSSNEELFRLKLFWTKLHLSLETLLERLEKRESTLLAEMTCAQQ